VFAHTHPKFVLQLPSTVEKLHCDCPELRVADRQPKITGTINPGEGVEIFLSGSPLSPVAAENRAA